MSSATLKSVFVRTDPSKIDNDETLGYEFLKTKDDYECSTIIQQIDDPNLAGSQYTLVSSGGVFPDDIQATMKPYFDRGGSLTISILQRRTPLKNKRFVS